MSKGEGSHGGHVIGHTKSGKPIYEAGHHMYQNDGGYSLGQLAGHYSAAEHREAAAAHLKAGDHHWHQSMAAQASGDVNKERHHRAVHRAHIEAAGMHEGHAVRLEDEPAPSSRKHVVVRTPGGPRTRAVTMKKPSQGSTSRVVVRKRATKGLEDMDFQKSGGEGSRGGKVIGHDKHGRPIYEDIGSVMRTPSVTGKPRYSNAYVHARRAHNSGKKPSAIGQAMVDSHPGWSADDHEAQADHLAQSEKRHSSEDHSWEEEHYHREAAKVLRQKTKKGFSSMDFRKSGGEGSRGGSIIGHTKSGKPIYSAGHHIYTRSGSIASGHGTAGREIGKYSEQDHQDAHDLHKKKSKEAMDAAVARHKSGQLTEAEGEEYGKRIGQHNQAAEQHINAIHNPNMKNYRKNRDARLASAKKSISCPTCEMAIPRAYAMKSLAALAKGHGFNVPENMAKLVKGDGIKHITCPECVSTVSPQYAVKSLGVLARSEGYDIEPALRSMFGKSLDPQPQAVLPIAQPVSRQPSQFDQQLAAHIEKHGFLSAAHTSGRTTVAAPHQPHAVARMPGPNEIIGADGRIVNVAN